jgi:hypothetical protein
MATTKFVKWVCRSCGAVNETEVDFSARMHQEIDEECAVCDHVHLLVVDIDSRSQEVAVDARAENR